MPNVDIGGCLGYAVDRFKADLTFHLLTFLVFMTVAVLSLGLLAGPICVGYIRAVRKQAAGGSAEFGDLFSAMDTFVPTFILLLVMVVASIVPFGSFVFTPVYFTALYLVALGENDGIASMKRAFELCQPVFLMCVVASLVFTLVNVAGLLLCCIGVFVTGPISILAHFRMAEQLMPPPPPTSFANVPTF